MWRVAISVLAAVFDASLLLLLALAMLGYLMEPSVASPPASNTATHVLGNLQALIITAVLMAGIVLNLLAIGFGARLRPSRRATTATIAAEFS